MDRLLLQVQALGGDPFAGGAWVFRNRAGTRIKVLCVDAQGVWLAVRRLHHGRFIWPRAGDAVWSLGELALTQQRRLGAGRGGF